MTDAIQIVTTFPTKLKAEEVARALVLRRLVACAQVGGPITSTYRWEGALDTNEEFTLTLKTRRELFDAVADALKELHPYEVPEILATAIVAGSAEYLAWIDENVGPVE